MRNGQAGKNTEGRDNNKFHHPILKEIKTNCFSLFTQKPNIHLDIPEGVLCLAGANGIGKSTFLSTINYALTGCVPHPSRKFKSATDYYRDSLSFTEEYFNGRISELDRDEASVHIQFTINNYTFNLTRGLFELHELQNLSISNDDGQLISNLEYSSPIDRNNDYKKYLTSFVGLESFEQYVFLQHFLFTFDESRHLIFWDDRVLELALFLCFGGNPEEATKIEKLRKNESSFDSRGRNKRYQANDIKKRLNILIDLIGDSDFDNSINEHYDSLRDNLEKTAEARDNTEHKIYDAKVKLAEASAKIAILNNTYQKDFANHINKSNIMKSHPVISEILNLNHCSICGTTDESLRNSVIQSIDNTTCPLCKSEFEESPSDDSERLESLKEIDKELYETKISHDNIAKTFNRLNEELNIATINYRNAESELEEFEVKHDEHIKKLTIAKKYGDAGDDSISILKSEYDRLIASSKESYKKRDLIRSEIKDLQKSLEKKFTKSEDIFVPQFRELAELFLGIDLDVKLEGKRPSNLTLVIELQSKTRRAIHQLSESQRFFVDIALRMALTQFMTKQMSSAALYIDTPEGSLDIAYESKAGEMFAKFASHLHNIVMTANINSSELLRKLALICGDERLELVRMTTWTDLSDVQIEQEDLFNIAYQKIEEVLRDQRH